MPNVDLGDIEKHFWLTRSVARCLGVSLTEAMAEGQLSPEGYAELITRCRASHCCGQCEVWLATQQDLAGSAPNFCANADILNALRRGSKSGM
ncbi:hypothetical protein HW561_01300 [Rhodobacteraceae bacterium B1Z28]|uniref:DUF6455 domain-containing protein n=1 Tax=Ruegeria haliotis TaxID=2747601 RepID=A0ABX2PKY2_9RHOB|nr:DUF6455 family protein [Ruegeria haliotis]NVO54425.1 hypothetical protein [Ruegeria haliotis]